MSQFIIKNFQKKQAVKAYVVYPNKRVKLFWAIPKDGFIKVDKKQFIVDDKSFYLGKDNIQTYYYDSNHVEPLNIFNPDKPLSSMTPDDFDTAISAQVAREIFNATAGGVDKSTIALLLSGVTLLAVIVVGYMALGNIDTILTKLQELEDLLKLIGGM